MLGLWRPWQHASSVTRKITITGNATVKAIPDEFVFNPSFERTGTDVNKLKGDLNTYGTKLNADLKKLGIAENDIKLDSSSYNNNYYSPTTTTTDTQTITLQATIMVPNKTLAQKVQDYLAGTDAKGQLTSQPQFSDSKRKSLESSARLQAIADARQKADQTASNLGAKLGKVIEVTDQQNISVRPLGVINDAASASTSSSLPVTPGKNQVDSTVQVVFSLK